MSVLDRSALEQSPLADLHAIASELAIDGYRRLRRAELIDTILDQQGEKEADDEPRAGEAGEGRRRRGRRGGRGRGGAAAEDASSPEDAPSAEGVSGIDPSEAEAGDEEPALPEEEEFADTLDAPPPNAAAAVQADAPERGRRAEDESVEGVVELLPNGSGFLRVAPPEPSDEDVYISAAQAKRCELVSGDRVAGPRRAPRRSERFASLIRIDTINGAPAADLASGARFDDLPAAFPQERFRLGSDDPTINAIEWLTPIGKGSRVAIVGSPRAGKSEALRRLAAVLAQHDELQLSIALAGVRPEELAEWGGVVEPLAAVPLGGSSDAQDHTVELAVDQARRIAARGGDAVVLIDTLDGLHPQVARKALAGARNIADGGSLTIIATAAEPLGGETTVISLDVRLASTGRFPALDLAASGTIRPELLVGEAGAEAIARARREAIDE